MSELRAKKSGLDSLVGTGEIFEPDTRKFEAKPGSKTEEQIKAIIAAGADATDVGGLPENLKGKSIRVDTTPDPVSQEPMGPPMQPQGEEEPEEKPGAKIDAAQVAKDKIKLPSTPDYRKMTEKEIALTEAQKQKLSDLKARQELAPQAMKESLFGTLAQLSSQYATDPDAKLLGKVGEFARIGGQQYQEGKAKQQELKEKITDTKIDLAKADVDLERYKDEKASKADQVKFENIIKKEMYGLALPS